MRSSDRLFPRGPSPQHRHGAAPVEMAGASRRRRVDELLGLFGSIPRAVAAVPASTVGRRHGASTSPHARRRSQLLLMDEPFRGRPDHPRRVAGRGRASTTRREDVVLRPHDIEEAAAARDLDRDHGQGPDRAARRAGSISSSIR